MEFPNTVIGELAGGNGYHLPATKSSCHIPNAPSIS